MEDGDAGPDLWGPPPPLVQDRDGGAGLLGTTPVRLSALAAEALCSLLLASPVDQELARFGVGANLLPRLYTCNLGLPLTLSASACSAE